MTGGASAEEMLTVTGAIAMNRQVSASGVGLVGGINVTTCIPLPASATAPRRCPPDKGRPLPTTPTHGSAKPPGSLISASSSRSASPSQTTPSSFIPRAPSSGQGSRPNSSLIPPGSKIPSNPYVQQHAPSCPPPTHNGPQSKHSMLDKLKLFNKDKALDRQKGGTNVISKRTSSSSGFSSAKSERSDSSLSLNEVTNSSNSHIRVPGSGSVPKNSRHVDPQLKSSNKNIKSRLGSNTPAKDLSIVIKDNQKINCGDTISRSSPKLRDKESKIAPPKLLLGLKPQSDQDVKAPKPIKTHDTKIARLSGSHLRIPEPKIHSPTSDGAKMPLLDGKPLKQPKTGLSNQLTNNTNPAFSSQTSVNSTGIPKPTAAVKGQTKVPKDERNPTLSVTKSMSTQMSPNHSTSNLNSSSGSLPFSRDSSLSKECTPQKQTLAVSPMPVSNVKDSGENQNSASQTSDTATVHHTNLSESSIIHRPSSESSVDSYKHRQNMISSNRSIDLNESYLNDVISEADSLEKEAAKMKLHEDGNGGKILQTSLVRKDMERSMKTISENSPSHARDNSLEDENPTMNVLPMRPLLRGYNSHLTLPIRSTSLSSKNLTPGFPHHANTVKANFGRDNTGNYARDRSNYVGVGYNNQDYCDVDVMSGYMSDGDCLRRLNMSELEASRNEMLDGYMSEGGASIYGRRLQSSGMTLQPFEERCGRQPASSQAPGPRPTMESPGPGGPHVVYRVVGQRVKKSDSGQQTDPGGGNHKAASSNGHSSKNGDSQWKKYTDSPGVGSPVQNAPPSPSHSRKSDRRAGGGSGGHHSPSHQRRAEKISAAQQLGVSGHHQSPNPACSPLTPNTSANSSSSSGGSGRVKGVPQSFGYAKRQGGQHQLQTAVGRTAQVSAVPRTKVKVSGGTQTCTQDLQIHKNGCGPKSFSLGPTSAAQLSQSVRERLLGSQSLPKPGTHEFIALFQHHRASPRGGMKISDGSLSDTQTYSEVKSEYGNPYAPWLRHSNTYSAGGRLSDGESSESLASPHCNAQQTHRAAIASKVAAQREGARLNRSNSIRSTKSEKLYPSMLQRSSESDYEPYYCLPVQYGPPGSGITYGTSEPPSPSPRSALSPSHGTTIGLSTPMQSHGLPTSQLHSVRHSHHYSKKNDEVHGSSASLVSTASSLHGTGVAEERHAMEVRKLRRELADAKDKVHTLTTQLTTNAHVVSAFEQSLSNMTQKLHQLTATAERKDSELTELRQTIELLRKQSIQAGLTTAHMQSMGINADVNMTGEDSVNSTPGQKSSPQHRPGIGGPNQVSNGAMTRHLSTDSVSSLSSGSSAATDKKHKKKGWLRSSFTKAFSRNAKIGKTAKHSSLGQLSSQDSSSMGSQQNHYDDPHTIREGSNENSLEHSHELLTDNTFTKPGGETATNDSTSAVEKPSEEAVLVDELKRQLREKDLVLTDIRLEALSSAHQLESLKDTVIKMRSEMMNLKQNNERLQRLVTSRSLTGSQSSLGTSAQSSDDPRRYSLADQATAQHQPLDVHSQSLDLDFNCISSTPTLDYTGKLSPGSQQNDIYGKVGCSLTTDISDPLLSNLQVNGCGDVFASSGLNGRLSTADCDINTVLPPPKSRELAIGESYSDIGITDNQGDTDGKKISIAVYLGQPETFPRYFEEQQDTMTEAECRFYAKRSSSMFNNHHSERSNFESPRTSHVHSPESVPETDFQNRSNTNSLKSNKSTHSYKNHCNCEPANTNEFTIAYTYISGKTTWQNLDYIVRKTFKDYLSRIDPGTNLGLNTDSITSYHLGEATRGPEISFPELLPCGYIIGTVKTLYICLQGVGSLAFDSLIPKNIVYRYISLLSEHRRVILCGPSGTGKSYLAARLAEFYVQKTRPRANPAEAVATFNVDHKTSKELRQYLVNIAEQCNAAEEEELRSGGSDSPRACSNGDNISDTDSALPAVIILDNLHHASALGEAFSGLLTAKANRLPVIIGTMSQATCNTTNLQLHHNFRWLLTANHMEPVKGFLARYLRRKLFCAELSRGHRDPALGAVLEWLPGVWQTLNAFLEQHSSSDVTIGPRLFLACPMDVDASQAWFADVWNYSVVPYVSAAAREGVALYGRRPRAANSTGTLSGTSDPLIYVKSTYPWLQPNNSHALRGIALEDIGLDSNKSDNNAESNEDPLLNMLMRLQEAANYGGNQSQDSDNASIDSNLTHDNSADNDL